MNIPGYEIIRELGRNPAGGRVVYLARPSNEPQNLVVIKQFQFAKGGEWSDFQAIEREMQVLQDLDHPGIPRYLGSLQTDDGHCLIQEYKNAKPLSEPRSFDPDEVKQIAIAVLEILIYLQNRIPPIIHRDIKPENVLVDRELNVYLIDFGFARIGGNDLALSSLALGTPGFTALEQLNNKNLTKATDLYGLGIMLIALLTQTKSTAINTLIDDDGQIAFKDRLPTLSLSYIRWLEKMVAYNVKNRYPNAKEALKALQPLDLIRQPSVNISASNLEFTATKLGEKVTQTITISNPTPETVLEGEWEVTSHPNDPPHTPDSHAWISFSPKEFKGNNPLSVTPLIVLEKIEKCSIYSAKIKYFG